MKINEVEEILGISRSNIRFYEKAGLISPSRDDNEYRNYSEEDIAKLKEVVVLRKLGLTVTDIKDIMSGDKDVTEEVAKNIEALEDKIAELNGSLAISKEIVSKPSEKFDTEYYWNRISEEEARGNRFKDIAKDFAEFQASHLDGWTFNKEAAKNEPYKKRLIKIAGIFVSTIVTIVIIFYAMDLSSKAFFDAIFMVVCWLVFDVAVNTIAWLASRKYPEKSEEMWERCRTTAITATLALGVLILVAFAFEPVAQKITEARMYAIIIVGAIASTGIMAYKSFSVDNKDKKDE